MESEATRRVKIEKIYNYSFSRCSDKRWSQILLEVTVKLP